MVMIDEQCDHVVQVDPTQVLVNPYQPRREFAPEELEDLAQSIKSVGLIHPPTVRRVAADRYELISGERRLRACQQLRLKSISVIVRVADSQQSAEAALIENVQRVDLNPLEIAIALQRLTEEFSFSQEELAVRVGKKRSTVANYLRLLALPRAIQQSLSKNLITMGHAKVILSVRDPLRQLLVHERVISEELTVRQTEQLAEKFQGKIPEPSSRGAPKRDADLEALERQLQQHLGTKVELQKDKVVIHYYSLDDLDRVLDQLGVGEAR